MAKRLTGKDKLNSLLRVTGLATMMFGGISVYQGNEKFYNEVAMPLIRHLDPELAHEVAVKALKWGVLRTRTEQDPPSLVAKVWNLEFKNPIGMAAGFDKQGEASKGLLEQGFGFVEIGSVTPKAQPGNPKPRVFRLQDDRAVINRYGFNSEGQDAVHERLIELKRNEKLSGVVGVNLGKNRTTEDAYRDYADGLLKFSDVADYFVINVSSPNTPGLRDLQSKGELEELLIELNRLRYESKLKQPLLLKLAPDLTKSERDDIVEVIGKEKSKVDGLVLCNTTVSRDNLTDDKKNEIGGLSGAPLNDASTEMIADMYKRTGGRIPIVGVGGIFDGRDALEKIKAGASLVQIYTSFVYHGPPVVDKIKRELNELLKDGGFDTVADAVGKN